MSDDPDYDQPEVPSLLSQVHEALGIPDTRMPWLRF